MWHCIYCGSTTSKLSREHIIPKGLNGNLVLPKSSCESCATITSRLEAVVLRGALWATRIYRQIKSRKHHSTAPKTFPIELEINGQWVTKNLPVDECPILLHYPMFPPPRVLSSPGTEGSGIKLDGVQTVLMNQSAGDTLSRLGATSVRTTNSQQPLEFARMIAKIAYSAAAANGDLAKLRSPSPIPDVILGKNTDIGYWVGMFPTSGSKPTSALHKLVIYGDLNARLLIVEVQLFSDSPSPCYMVVLGELAEEV